VNSVYSNGISNLARTLCAATFGLGMRKIGDGEQSDLSLNPWKVDTDGDGIPDRIEFAQFFDPLDRNSNKGKLGAGGTIGIHVC